MFDAVIVAYNSAALVDRCLQSLLAQSLRPRTITVVDNSPEASEHSVHPSIKDVQLLRCPDNLGFAGGCNLGAAQGQADILLFLNPDVLLRQDWLETAANLFLQGPDIAVVGGKLFFPDRCTVQHAGGTVHYPLATTSHRTKGAREPDNDEPDYVTGAAMAVRRQAFQQLGGFDVQFWPVYYEDVDLCWRARAGGWRVVYSPQLVGIHAESSSIDRSSFNYYFWLHQQRLRFVLKHFTTDQLIRDFIPAETARIRGDITSVELEASLSAYRWVTGGDLPAAPSLLDVEENWLRMLGELQDTWELREPDLKSEAPVLGPVVTALRRFLNGLSTRWYVLQIMSQQREFNAAVFRLLRELVRRQRSAEGPYLLALGVLTYRLRELERQLKDS
jgi:GT2 family glycosyltransferase